MYWSFKKKGYRVSSFDPKFKNFNLINKKNIDVIFNALHGRDGEDGVAQSYFEYLKIPYTHSGVISSYSAMNKIISKEIFKKNRIKTPKFFSISQGKNDKKKIIGSIKSKRINFPVVLKPINEGSSLGVEICKKREKLFKSINRLLKNYNEIILEEYIAGQEIQVAVINGNALGAIELIPKRLFYDYKAKYTKKANTEHIMPARLNKKIYRSFKSSKEST